MFGENRVITPVPHLFSAISTIVDWGPPHLAAAIFFAAEDRRSLDERAQTLNLWFLGFGLRFLWCWRCGKRWAGKIPEVFFLTQMKHVQLFFFAVLEFETCLYNIKTFPPKRFLVSPLGMSCWYLVNGFV